MGKVIVVESVPERVSVLVKLRVFAAVPVRVYVPVVNVLPLIEVAVATPREGVVKVGEVARTTFPDPVVASSPKIPELSYRILPFVPEVIPVDPTVRPAPEDPQSVPVPETTPEVLT